MYELHKAKVISMFICFNLLCAYLGTYVSMLLEIAQALSIF